MPLIDINDVSKLYGFGEAATIALDEVNFVVEENEFIAVMGPSGSGKSTLMNIIGFLDEPTHGDYKLNGRMTSKLSNNQKARLRRDTVGFVFQTSNLLPKMTILENVALPLAYKGLSPITQMRRAGEILDRMGLAHREYFYPRQLSGGEIQRVAIARALINDPKLIIADEPTGNLDSESSKVVMELLSEIHKAGNTVLMVTHNPALTKYANRVVYVHDGRIIHDEKNKIGDIPEILKRSMYFVSKKTTEDDAAGVSALMKNIPGDLNEKKKPKKRSRRRSKSTKSRVKSK
ncbi:MAG TPA: ABC transporter ATP-binding protein [Candidatus Saccharibacteria bacterium]|nr:ABC transporter ATP-binding protein [Candidatus Saccharibacteria bacterium]